MRRIMRRHKCTLCRKKRREHFLRPVRTSDKPGSRTWICVDGCSDGRRNKIVQSFLQDGQSLGPKVQSLEDLQRSFDQAKQSDAEAAESIPPGRKAVLDVCCGNRMFWFNKKHPLAIYSDIKAGVATDIVQDYRKLKYADSSFNLVVFDPPHLFKSGRWLDDKYGTLSGDKWPMDIKKGFDECMRVLKDYGVLIFKWSEGAISVSTVIAILDAEPLFGHTSDKKNRTHWMCFMKIPESKQQEYTQ